MKQYNFYQYPRMYLKYLQNILNKVLILKQLQKKDDFREMLLLFDEEKKNDYK